MFHSPSFSKSSSWNYCLYYLQSLVYFPFVQVKDPKLPNATFSSSQLQGSKTRASEDLTHAWAVSLTEWDSLASHARFVQKETSVPFFERTAKISRGPPTVDHYQFKNLHTLGGSDGTRVVFEKHIAGGKSADGSAASLDNEGLFCRVSPVKVDTESLPSCVDRYFDVLWYSCEHKVVKSSL